MRLSVKVGVICACAALLPLIIALPIVFYQVSTEARIHTEEKLQTRLRAAQSVYDKRLAEMVSAAERLASDIANGALVSSDNASRDNATVLARLQDMLAHAHDELGLDFLIVSDPFGRVISRHNDRPAAGETVSAPGAENPVAVRVIAEGGQKRNGPAAACALERSQRLAQLGLDHVAKVRTRDGGLVEDSLMLEAGAPVFSGGRFVGTVLIGQMLNNFYVGRAHAGAGPAGALVTPLVAEVRQILQRDVGEDSGALVELGGVIIASSLAPADGSSGSAAKPGLLGVKHSSAALEETLHDGAHYYGTAWAPLKGLDGAALGAIGVALPADEFDRAAAGVRTTLLVAAAFAFSLFGGAGFFFGTALGSRLSHLTGAAKRMSVGELSTSVEDLDPLLPGWIPARLAQDEVKRLAEQMDLMRESVRQAIERLRRR